jgi:hypothetical protein
VTRAKRKEVYSVGKRFVKVACLGNIWHTQGQVRHGNVDGAETQNSRRTVQYGRVCRAMQSAVNSRRAGQYGRVCSAMQSAVSEHDTLHVYCSHQREHPVSQYVHGIGTCINDGHCHLLGCSTVDFSEARINSIFRVENQPNKKPAYIR